MTHDLNTGWLKYTQEQVADLKMNLELTFKGLRPGPADLLVKCAVFFDSLGAPNQPDVPCYC